MLILALAALAAGPITEPKTVNVDRDRAFERLVPRVVKDEHGFEQRRVVLEDNCGRLKVLGPHDTIARMQAREVDGVTGWPEIVVEGRSGAASRFGTTRVLHLDRCRLRALFHYRMSRPPYRAPRGWYVVTAGRRRTSTWLYASGRFTRRSVRYGDA